MQEKTMIVYASRYLKVYERNQYAHDLELTARVFIPRGL